MKFICYICKIHRLVSYIEYLINIDKHDEIYVIQKIDFK
ncbi:hypothetical protein SC08_Contig83orf02998 [Clostridium butyricum]|nr:hypothetical protein SC08_Contig83orf02998 [Clostridium butyricum]